MDNVKITVVSGFLGAGKTTLIKHFIRNYAFGPKPVWVENDYGSLGIDAQELSKFGVEIKDFTAGCICCSLKSDFIRALSEILETQQFSHVIIEPSGIGKLSDILDLVRQPSFVHRFSIKAITAITLVDARRFKHNDRYVTEFFWDQIQNSRLLLLNRTEKLPDGELEEIYDTLRQHQISAPILDSANPNSTGFIRDFLDAPSVSPLFQPIRRRGKVTKRKPFPVYPSFQ